MGESDFFRYLKEKRWGILLFFLCVGIFLTVFFAERLPVSSVLYGSLLSIFPGLFFFMGGFLSYVKRQGAFKILERELLAGNDPFSGDSGIWDKDYLELLKSEYEIRKASEEKTEKRQREMMDYYTAWVHQIKTPIAAMHLLLKEDTAHDRELRSELFKIEEYVEMVLSYLRLSGDTTDFVIKKTSLEALVRQTVRKYAGFFIAKKIRFTLLDVDTEILTDEKWLAFVLEQLLSNALKYTKEGEIRIYLEKPKTLVIEDTGIGIAPEDLPRICERGFTGYNGRVDKKATGIGLYLCKEILTRLSHSLEITSEPGKGSAVRIGLDYVDYRHE